LFDFKEFINKPDCYILFNIIIESGTGKAVLLEMYILLFILRYIEI